MAPSSSQGLTDEASDEERQSDALKKYTESAPLATPLLGEDTGPMPLRERNGVAVACAAGAALGALVFGYVLGFSSPRAAAPNHIPSPGSRQERAAAATTRLLPCGRGDDAAMGAWIAAVPSPGSRQNGPPRRRRDDAAMSRGRGGDDACAWIAAMRVVRGDVASTR